MRDWTTLYRIYTVFFLLLAANVIVYALAPDFYARFIAGEDRATEWIGFFSFFIACITGIMILRRFGPRMNRKILVILLGQALFYFLCAGEEISWGQRLLGFETPQAILEHNQQQEFNIHNLRLPVLHSRDIMGAYVYLYGILLPLFYSWRNSTRNSAWRGWVFHPGIAVCFLFAELLNAVREPLYEFLEGRNDPAVNVLLFHQIEESVEMYWGLSAMFGMLLIHRHWWRTRGRQGG